MTALTILNYSEISASKGGRGRAVLRTGRGDTPTSWGLRFCAFQVGCGVKCCPSLPCLALPLGLALFHALPKYLQDSSLLPSRLVQGKDSSKGKGNHTSISTGSTTALSEASGVWRVIHKLDRKGEGGAEGISLCRESLFHQSITEKA